MNHTRTSLSVLGLLTGWYDLIWSRLYSLTANKAVMFVLFFIILSMDVINHFPKILLVITIFWQLTLPVGITNMCGWYHSSKRDIWYISRNATDSQCFQQLSCSSAGELRASARDSPYLSDWTPLKGLAGWGVSRTYVSSGQKIASTHPLWSASGLWSWVGVTSRDRGAHRGWWTVPWSWSAPFARWHCSSSASARSSQGGRRWCIFLARTDRWAPLTPINWWPHTASLFEPATHRPSCWLRRKHS